MLKDPNPSSGRRFHVVSASYWPDRAPRPGKGWPADMVLWRNLVLQSAPRAGVRYVALAWIISGLARKSGYAYASNSTLAKTAYMADGKVDEVLRALESNGMIFRAHVRKSSSSFERRVWPTLKPNASKTS